MNNASSTIFYPPIASHFVIMRTPSIAIHLCNAHYHLPFLYIPVMDDWYATPTPQMPLSLLIAITPATFVPWEDAGNGSSSLSM